MYSMPRTALLALARHSLRHHSRLQTLPPTGIHHHHVAVRRAFSMSSSTHYPPSSWSKEDADAEPSAAATNQEQQKQGLPAPGEGTPITLDVSGDGSTVKLSDLGPLVVNVDGTVARITNWKEMTEAERETTVRMVGKRNKQRLDALKKSKEEQEGGASSSQ